MKPGIATGVAATLAVATWSTLAVPSRAAEPPTSAPWHIVQDTNDGAAHVRVADVNKYSSREECEQALGKMVEENIAGIGQQAVHPYPGVLANHLKCMEVAP